MFVMETESVSIKDSSYTAKQVTVFGTIASMTKQYHIKRLLKVPHEDI